MKMTILETTQLGSPANIDVLKKRIADFFDNTDISDGTSNFKNLVSPRIFRIKLGISKQTLSYWKTSKSKKEMFDLIKTYEDMLLAFIEQATISLALTKNKNHRVNILGLFNTLRAYDTHLYVPESRPVNTDRDKQEPIVIEMTNQSKLNLNNLTKEKAGK